MTDTVAMPAAGGTADIESNPSFRVVHRTILRPDQEIDIRPMYVGGVSGFGGTEAESSAGASGDTSDAGDAVNYSSSDRSAATEAVSLSGYGKITDEGALVMPERRLTFGTYFNAFPAGYWRRWTSFASVRLQVTVRGEGSLTVYRSTAKGHVQRADGVTFDTSEPTTYTCDLPLKPFIDGGWYWYDVEAGEQEAMVISGVWGFETEKTRAGIVSIGITTFNRPDFCVDQLVALGNEPEVLDVGLAARGDQEVLGGHFQPLVAPAVADGPLAVAVPAGGWPCCQHCTPDGVELGTCPDVPHTDPCQQPYCGGGTRHPAEQRTTRVRGGGHDVELIEDL